MSPVFECPACETLLKASPEMAGRSLRCPNCRQLVSIPQPGEEAELTRTARSGRGGSRSVHLLKTHWMWFAAATPLLLVGLLAFGNGPAGSQTAPAPSDHVTAPAAAEVSPPPRPERETADIAVEPPSVSEKGPAAPTVTDSPRRTILETADYSPPIIPMEDVPAAPESAADKSPPELQAVTVPTESVGMPPDTPVSLVAASDSSDVSSWPALDRLTSNVRWPHPQLSDANLQEWSQFIRPTQNDLEWRKVRWHTELAVAAEEARRLQRPILLWTMNGHPCGET